MKNNWQTKKLGELCEKITDGSHFSPKSIQSGSYPYITVRDIKNDGQIDFENCKFIDAENYILLTKNGCQPFYGDVLFSKDGTVGKVSLVDFKKDFVVLSSLAIIRPRQSIIDSYYLKYILQSPSFLNTAIGNKTGVAIKRIILKNLGQIQISYPESLSEQKRIVALLDDIFEKIEKAKKNTEKNLQNSRELFEAYLQNIFQNSNFDYKLLGEICDVIGGGTPSKANGKFYNGDIPWATVRDMKNDIIKETEHKITKDAVKNSSTNIIPKNNVVITTRVGLGKICLLEHDTAINQDLRGIVPLNSNKLSVNYLFWWFKSISQIIIDNGTGATVHGVKLPFIKGLLIPLPSISGQKVIVKKLDELSMQTKKLEEIYKNKLADLEELKKSVLKKAFAGEL